MSDQRDVLPSFLRHTLITNGFSKLKVRHQPPNTQTGNLDSTKHRL